METGGIRFIERMPLKGRPLATTATNDISLSVTAVRRFLRTLVTSMRLHKGEFQGLLFQDSSWESAASKTCCLRSTHFWIHESSFSMVQRTTKIRARISCWPRSEVCGFRPIPDSWSTFIWRAAGPRYPFRVREIEHYRKECLMLCAGIMLHGPTRVHVQNALCFINILKLFY